MDASGIITGGFLLGLAGSLHCAGMCGCIASGALFTLSPQTLLARCKSLALMHAGRLSVYVLLGAVCSGAMSLALAPTASNAQFVMTRWASSAVIIWIGLSMAGVLPRVELPAFAGAARKLSGLLSSHQMARASTPTAFGLLWGATPCPMVYAALFSASLTGSYISGALWMAAYGLGTIPAVTAAALGLSYLQALRKNGFNPTIAGMAIAGFGFSSALMVGPTSQLFCLTR